MNFFGGWTKKFSLGERAHPVNVSLPTLRQPEPILLPAHSGFIAFSLILAFLLNLIPWGRVLWMPDFVALVLVFWNVHQPRRVGIGLAWLFGVLMDVHEAGVLGEHALAYTVLSYAAITIHRRVLWLPLLGQAVHVLPLLLLAQMVTLAIRLSMHGAFPGLAYLLESVVAAFLWPLMSLLLLAPQRRAIDKDENRPL